MMYLTFFQYSVVYPTTSHPNQDLATDHPNLACHHLALSRPLCLHLLPLRLAIASAPSPEPLLSLPASFSGQPTPPTVVSSPSPTPPRSPNSAALSSVASSSSTPTTLPSPRPPATTNPYSSLTPRAHHLWRLPSPVDALSGILSSSTHPPAHCRPSPLSSTRAHLLSDLDKSLLPRSTPPTAAATRQPSPIAGHAEIPVVGLFFSSLAVPPTTIVASHT